MLHHFRILYFLWLGVFFINPTPSWALVMGKSSIQSQQEEGLRVVIALDHVHPEEQATLTARIASPEIYQQLGVIYHPAFEQIQTQFIINPDHGVVVEVHFLQPITDTRLDLVLEVASQASKAMRLYRLDIPSPVLGTPLRLSTRRYDGHVLPSAPPAPSAPSAPIHLILTPSLFSKPVEKTIPVPILQEPTSQFVPQALPLYIGRAKLFQPQPQPQPIITNFEQQCMYNNFTPSCVAYRNTLEMQAKEPSQSYKSDSTMGTSYEFKHPKQLYERYHRAVRCYQKGVCYRVPTTSLQQVR